jgi:hypothetical protein
MDIINLLSSIVAMKIILFIGIHLTAHKEVVT